MEDGNSIIYGLEHQTRSLSPQYAESEAIRFLIGTQSLKPNSNQVHVVELEEDTGALHTKLVVGGGRTDYPKPMEMEEFDLSPTPQQRVIGQKGEEGEACYRFQYQLASV